MDAVDVQRRWGIMLWRAWEALGVSSWERQPPASVVDPEALIIATLRHDDLRLHGEVVDWGSRHQHLVSLRRLRALARRAGIEAQAHSWIDSTSVARAATATSATRTTPIAPIAATAALRLRALTGTTVRSDIIRGLHPVLIGGRDPMTVGELTDEIGLTRAHVLNALTDLVVGGVVRAEGSPRRRRYAPVAIDPFSTAVWAPWREYAYAPWLRATAIVAALLEMRRELAPGSVASVAAAMHGRDRISDDLGSLLGQPARQPRPGPAHELAPELVRLLDDDIAAIIDLLEAPLEPRH